MISAIIIDDEPHAREAIFQVIDNYFDDISVVAQAGSVKEAVKQIQNHNPDFLFLDIDLPDGCGFDVLEMTERTKYRVIFITAHQEHALRAIKFSAFDYILKPVKPTEIVQAVNNLKEDLKDKEYVKRFDTMFANINHAYPELKKLTLKTAERIYVVNIKDIIRCHSDNAYTTFHMNDGTKILVSKPIGKYDELLTGLGFLRIHRSHLINLNYIKHYEKAEGGYVVMTDNCQVPVSNQKKQDLMKFFDSL